VSALAFWLPWLLLDLRLRSSRSLLVWLELVLS
jgi:hypothetical protein